MKKLFILFASVALITSCSLNQHYHFNQDFSGNYIFEFDMSSLVGMMGSDSTGADSEDIWSDIPMDSLQDVFNAMEGISNAKVFVEDDVLKMYYDFANVESLNNAIKNTNSEEGEGDDEDEMYGMLLGSSSSFETNGKNKLIFNAPSLEDMDMEDSLQVYMEMLTFNTEFSFDKTIKSVNNDGLTVSEDKKSLNVEGNFAELMKGEKELSFEVKLK